MMNGSRLSSALLRPPGRRYTGYALDLDGTVYLDDALLPGADEAIAQLRRDGARVVFVTNKTLESAQDYAKKLTRLNIPATPDDVVTALDALVLFLQERHPQARLLTVAEPLVGSALTEAGLTVVSEPEDADIVVVSFDRTFDYAKLHAAYRAVRSGAVIVATNADPYCPTADGGLPDCAAMTAAIEACTGVRAKTIVGKPSPHMAKSVLDRLGVPASEAAMVGDRLDTDVAMGKAAGMAGILVLTGATSPADLARSDIRPHAVVSTLAGVP
ncbi:HAD-IIA family hydrolase [Streptomyces sp. NPDC047108]|uniref:HAD-IIA family hydrolase n=1 Tax=Streptomyces sp. NPDC047108 TaxID=3155025 RepID=UPI0033DDB266